MTNKAIPTALGFRVKSGWATAVLLAGPSNALRLVSCQSILLCDPEVPQSKQPYHAVLGLSGNEAQALTTIWRRVVASAAKKSVEELLKQAGSEDYRVTGAGLVVGSLVDPRTLHNEHIRAHGLEGQLFRTALEDALRERNLPYQVLVEKDALATASALLQLSVLRARKRIARLGESHDGTWRAEEKLAALAAWMALGAPK